MREPDKCAGLVHIFSPMSSIWSRAILILAAIWLVAGGTIWWARHATPTPESLLRYVEVHPLDGQSEDRTSVV